MEGLLWLLVIYSGIGFLKVDEEIKFPSNLSTCITPGRLQVELPGKTQMNANKGKPYLTHPPYLLHPPAKTTKNLISLEWIELWCCFQTWIV